MRSHPFRFVTRTASLTFRKRAGGAVAEISRAVRRPNTAVIGLLALAGTAVGCAPKLQTPANTAPLKSPEAPAPRSTALRAADTLRDQGRQLEAVEAYAAAGQAEPSDHRPWHEIGRILLANNQPEDARDAFAEAIRREPGITVGDAWHGLATFRSGDPENGLKILREAVGAVPDNPEAYSLLGDACRDYGLLTEERTARESTVRLAPGNPEHWRNLGKACYSGKDFGRLADVGAKLTELDPDDPDGPVWKAMGVAMLGDDNAVADALPKARETAQRHPKRVFSHIAHGRLAKRAHAWQEAKDALRRALAIDPLRTDIYADLAVVEKMLGNAAAAKDASRKHQEGLAKRRAYEDAIRDARANPGNLSQQLRAVAASWEIGERRTARECLARARRQDPQNPVVEKWMQRLDGGQ